MERSRSPYERSLSPFADKTDYSSNQFTSIYSTRHDGFGGGSQTARVGTVDHFFKTGESFVTPAKLDVQDLISFEHLNGFGGGNSISTNSNHKSGRFKVLLNTETIKKIIREHKASQNPNSVDESNDTLDGDIEIKISIKKEGDGPEIEVC